MGTFMLAGLGGLVFLLIIAAIAMPGKSKSHPQLADLAAPLRHFQSDEPQPRDTRSLRERELEEDAEVLAAEFSRVRRQRYVDSLRADAAAYFGTDDAKPKKSA